MKKNKISEFVIRIILIFSIIISFSSFIFAQETENSVAFMNPKDFLKDYPIFEISEFHQIDSTLIITKASEGSYSAQIFGLYLTKIDYATNSFVTTKFNLSSKKSYGFNFHKIYKINGEIVKFRSEKSKNEMLYFKDLLGIENGEIVEATVPFFRGLISDGYTRIDNFIEMHNEFRLDFFTKKTSI